MVSNYHPVSKIMNYKEIIEDILKTKSKSKLCNELGISQYYLDKILHGGEIPNLVKEKIVNLVDKKPEDLIELTKDEAYFITDGSIETFPDKVNRISYLNYALNSDKAGDNHFWRQLLTKNGSQSKEETNKQLERMVKAILRGKWKTVKDDLMYMIKLPNGYYLTKNDDGSTGWSLVQNINTVTSNNTKELSEKYPEYSTFITQEMLKVSHFKPQGVKNSKFLIKHRKPSGRPYDRKNY